MSLSQMLVRGDCVETMRDMPEASIDAVVCDPPYDLTGQSSGRGFMGKAWDGTGISFCVETWREALRVLKPGGFLLAFGGTRTYHRLATAIEEAGFEIRDCLSWQYGSGFPHSLDVARSIEGASNGRGARYSASDPSLAVSEEKSPAPGSLWQDSSARTMADGKSAWTGGRVVVTDPAALAWLGWGTALKPAWEPIVVARRPLEGTVAANVLKHGTGALNIDVCRIESGDEHMVERVVYKRTAVAGDERTTSAAGMYGAGAAFAPTNHPGGRWPANVLLSCLPACDGDTHAHGCPCAALDAQSGGEGASRYFNRLPIEAEDLVPFIYAAKASRKEKNAGLPEGVTCTHPTVKPRSVMQHLVKLCCSKGGTVLDPFMGSGTTGVACVLEGTHFIGIELSDEYVETAKARIAHAGGNPEVIP